MKCSTPVPAEPDEVAWVCAQCGQGLLLFQEKELVDIEVNYAAGISPNIKGKPLWVAEGRVSVQRQSYGSSGKPTSESQRFWEQPRRFFVPAYSSSLEELLSVANTLLLQPPALQPGPTVPFEPVTLATEDIFPAAEFIVVAIEASRKDKLKQVDFELKLEPPKLWVLGG